jgi:hypothetical protein
LGFYSATEAQLVKITLESCQTREDSGNVSVEQGVRLTEGNAQNGPCGVIPNSRQRTNLLVVLGERPSKAANQFLGGLVQVTGAAIVAKS